ncbi:sodium:proline symporter [Helicobacter saguini]|uniref:Sodium/proline symporter n=1 Tax=Helicobacter saguini TaxID=1548018 RepID=A0A347VQV4_9HELI|nr:sodium:proline symporter [Helicobacter saguini]MWV66187.1 sodium:proline symporter [Helicobacter saguini]MWV68536.1 sodium:proline symporter [Helicobacter saguini]MWV71909.1 sodium:proline symporter [Helicobacter saguini]TLD95923.1 sodium:proline symporter [Helicobacter saguini]
MQNNVLEVQSLSFPIFATFGLYALVMIAIGFYFYRKTKNPEEFFLGGRNVGPTVSALSAGASDMSSWLLMGLPGALYVAGLLNAWIAIGLSCGMFINWLLVAKRLRIYTEVVSNSLTIPDYFETRFSDDKHILRLISAVVILVFFVFYISSGLIAGAKLFEQTFNIDYKLSLIIGAGIIVVYTFFGGYLAVCWTDLLQGLLMMAALIAVPAVLLYHLNGPINAENEVHKYDASYNEIVEKTQKYVDTEFDSIMLQTRESVASGDKDSIVNNLDMLVLGLNELDSISHQNTKDTFSKLSSEVAKVRDSIIKSENISKNDKDSILKILDSIESSKAKALEIKNHFSFFHGVTWIQVISAVAWGLGYFGQPHIIVRFMSIRSTRDIPKATAIGMSWMIISLCGACFVGMLGLAYVTKNNLTLNDPETIFIIMSQILFNPWITGLLLSALLAAIMSTASSQLLVSASTVAEDFYKKILKTDATPKQVMFFSRASVLVVSFVAFFLSIDENSTILSIVAYAWAGFGASFGSVMIFSLFWRRMTRMGAICGMLTGAIVVVVWKNFIYQYIPLYEIVPGFVCASIVIVCVSLLQPVRPGTKEAFDKMMSEMKAGNI